MFDLARFGLRDMTECGAALRQLGAGASSMEEVANRIVRYLYEHLVDKPSGTPSCALVRFFKTHPYEGLDAPLREFATRMLGGLALSPAMRCLTLLATAGDRPEWNSRKASVGHQAIPLPSPEMVRRAPMISNLIRQLGLEIEMVVQPGPDLLVDLEQRSFNVFHVPEAAGSSYIPAQQEFVLPCHIKSVLGFGGLLPSGSLFAVVMFSKCPIGRETAELFQPLALNVKMAVLPWEGTVFA
jgi:hypothetical protein